MVDKPTYIRPFLRSQICFDEAVASVLGKLYAPAIQKLIEIPGTRSAQQQTFHEDQTKEFSERHSQFEL
jgi:hypothetical protein